MNDTAIGCRRVSVVRQSEEARGGVFKIFTDANVYKKKTKQNIKVYLTLTRLDFKDAYQGQKK